MQNLTDEPCSLTKFKCRHASTPVFIREFCDLKTRKHGKKKRYSDDTHCNNIGCSVAELPVCPMLLKTEQSGLMVADGVSENVQRWYKKKRAKRIRTHLEKRRRHSSSIIII